MKEDTKEHFTLNKWYLRIHIFRDRFWKMLRHFSWIGISDLWACETAKQMLDKVYFLSQEKIVISLELLRLSREEILLNRLILDWDDVYTIIINGVEFI